MLRYHSLRDWAHVGVVLCELPTASSHFGSTGVLWVLTRTHPCGPPSRRMEVTRAPALVDCGLWSWCCQVVLWSHREVCEYECISTHSETQSWKSSRILLVNPNLFLFHHLSLFFIFSIFHVLSFSFIFFVFCFFFFFVFSLSLQFSLTFFHCISLSFTVFHCLSFSFIFFHFIFFIWVLKICFFGPTFLLTVLM